MHPGERAAQEHYKDRISAANGGKLKRGLVQLVMTKTDRLPESEIAKSRTLLREAIHLQKIEGNPLDANDLAMFEMFDREGWSHEQCIAYIRKRAKSTASVSAAE